jgi:transcriptional regulator with XRE-family HTH domain
MSRREFKINKVLCRKVGQKIKSLRLEKGLSQEALALEINVSGSFLGAIERAETDITLTMLHKISKALDTDWVEIIKVY